MLGAPEGRHAMPVLHFIPADAFKKALHEMFEVESEEQLRLRWSAKERENLFAEGYILELSEVVEETTSSTGVPFRRHIIGDGGDDAFEKEVLVPFSERTQLQEQAVVEGIEAREIGERGFPTCDVLLWYDS